MKVSIGSLNPVKVKAVKNAFELRFKENIQLSIHQVASGVPDQPFGDETIDGAVNRAKLALKDDSEAQYGVGLEGGITYHKKEAYAVAWCAVVNKENDVGLGCSFGVHLPSIIMDKINNGMELGDVLDEILNRKNIKHQEGFFGLATGNQVTRQDAYTNMVMSALYRFTTNDYKNE